MSYLARIVDTPAIGRKAWTVKLMLRPRQFHWMIGAISIGSGRTFASVWTLSADHPLFLMATHPEEMVNHPKEDSIRIHPPKDQNAHIHCEPGQGSIVNCLDFGTGFSF